MHPLVEDESDLSDLTSSEAEEDELSPPVVKKERQRKVVEKKDLKATLPTPRMGSWQIRTLHHTVTKRRIDLDPEYQRGVVWTESKQSSLIDSLFHNFYVPPVVVAKDRERSGKENSITCIDGKQRISSIRRFMDGEIPYRDSVTGQKYWYTAPDNNKSRKVLAEDIKETFGDIAITVIEYDDITSDQEREIFQRVQNGMALKAQERLQALTGPYPALIHKTLTAMRKSTTLRKWLTFLTQNTGGKDFEALAQVLYLIINAKENKGPSVQTLDAWIKSSPPTCATRHADDFESAVAVFYDVLPMLLEEMKREVDLVFALVFVHTWKTKLSLQQLAKGLGLVRKKLQGPVKSKEFKEGVRYARTMGVTQSRSHNGVIALVGKDEEGLGPAWPRKEDPDSVKIEKGKGKANDESSAPVKKEMKPLPARKDPVASSSTLPSVKSEKKPLPTKNKRKERSATPPPGSDSDADDDLPIVPKEEPPKKRAKRVPVSGSTTIAPVCDSSATPTSAPPVRAPTPGLKPYVDVPVMRRESVVVTKRPATPVQSNTESDPPRAMKPEKTGPPRKKAKTAEDKEYQPKMKGKKKVSVPELDTRSVRRPRSGGSSGIRKPSPASPNKPETQTATPSVKPVRSNPASRAPSPSVSRPSPSVSHPPISSLSNPAVTPTTTSVTPTFVMPKFKKNLQSPRVPSTPPIATMGANDGEETSKFTDPLMRKGVKMEKKKGSGPGDTESTGNVGSGSRIASQSGVGAVGKTQDPRRAVSEQQQKTHDLRKRTMSPVVPTPVVGPRDPRPPVSTSGRPTPPPLVTANPTSTTRVSSPLSSSTTPSFGAAAPPCTPSPLSALAQQESPVRMRMDVSPDYSRSSMDGQEVASSMPAATHQHVAASSLSQTTHVPSSPSFLLPPSSTAPSRGTPNAPTGPRSMNASTSAVADSSNAVTAVSISGRSGLVPSMNAASASSPPAPFHVTQYPAAPTPSGPRTATVSFPLRKATFPTTTTTASPDPMASSLPTSSCPQTPPNPPFRHLPNSDVHSTTQEERYRHSIDSSEQWSDHQRLRRDSDGSSTSYYSFQSSDRRSSIASPLPSAGLPPLPPIPPPFVPRVSVRATSMSQPWPEPPRRPRSDRTPRWENTYRPEYRADSGYRANLSAENSYRPSDGWPRRRNSGEEPPPARRRY